jgi:methylmalonyl-CoA mutase
MSERKNRLLFEEFPPVSAKEWEDKIKEDLKGADYQKKLIWMTPEGFQVQPYYRDEHLEDKKYLNLLPGEFPFARGNKTKSNRWEIRQDIYLDNIEEANDKSLFLLQHGITSLGYICQSEKGAMILKNQKDFSQLVQDINLEHIPLNFICGPNAPVIMDMLTREVEANKINKEQITGSIDFDPFGYLTLNGNFHTDEKTDFEFLIALLNSAAEKLPNHRVLGINGYFFTNSGATIIQELGYSLSMANEYLTRLTDSRIGIDSICRHVQFNLGVGSNYFMEIAKIRAARFLWAKVVKAYKPKDDNSGKVFIHSVTSEWNQTLYDPYMNVLRGTTESMAAVIGGTDSLVVLPFTYTYKPTTKFSARLARNIQIILNEEAFMGKVIDPAAGSYYIETLTDSIIDEVWKLFLKVESEGGYLQAVKKGAVQADINTTAKHRENLIDARCEILVGTNQYPNSQESVIGDVDEKRAFTTIPDKGTDVRPLKISRGSINFEKLRLATEKHSKRPVAFMLTLGDVNMRRTRATFSCNFFACGGYEIMDNPGFASVDEGVRAALDAGADIIVLCSSDEEYKTLAPEVHNRIRDKAILAIAGAPACTEELKALGIENFIHRRSNVVEILGKFHQKLGIAL